MAKDDSLLNIGKTEATEFERLITQKSDLEKQINNAIELQIDLGKDERLLTKIKQLKAQVEMVNEDLEKLDHQDNSDSLVWVERYLEQNEDLVNFPLAYNKMSDSEKNMFIQRYIEFVGVLDSEITEVKFTEEVERLKSLVSF